MALELNFTSQDVKILSDDTVYQGHFSMRKLSLQHRLFDGGWSEPLARELFERGDAVGVLPYDPVSDSIIFIEQFRPGAIRGNDSPWMLELIAGVVETGEEDEEVVYREAREEAACELSDLLPIASFYPSAGACSEQIRLFCGRVSRAGVGEVHGLDTEGEDILVHSIPLGEALEMLASGQITNGHTLIALQWLQINAYTVREKWA